jgi:hypothetical protein
MLLSPQSFEWLPTECADERYPMQLISGQLHCSNGEVVPVPAGKIVNNGWGEIGSRRLVGSPQKPVPQRLSASWFSYTEDQFFAGTLSLPQAELTQLFADGFNEPLTGERVTWSKVIVGMGLGGHTSVWLAGSGLVHELVRATFEPAQLEWARVLDNPNIARSEFIRSKLRSRLTTAQLKALAAGGPPVSTWPRYALRYRWRILVNGIQVPLYMFLRSFNGERHFYDFARRPPEVLDTVPKRMEITWLSRSGRKLLTKIGFDEAEVFGAFEKLSPAATDPSTMLLRIEYGTRSRVSISVELEDDRIPLGRSSVEVLSLAGD